jgi:hypothetical protein
MNPALHLLLHATSHPSAPVVRRITAKAAVAES